jgi:predicted extracellular nuclease
MKTKYTILIAAMVILGLASAAKKPDHFTAIFYNTENLFDTINDPAIADEEYLPDAAIPWNTARYKTKISHISRVLASVDQPAFPDIIGLAEIENRSVLENLVNSDNMKAGNYRIVHYDSPDERGIDVALLYKSKSFKLTNARPVRVKLPGTTNDKTRDILYVKGIALKSTTLHIFINHWPSRRGSQEASEALRIEAARVLRYQVDSVLKTNPSANILIMGDFNDNPVDKSIEVVLGSNPPETSPSPSLLYSILLPRFKSGEGSLYYKSWDMFDQIIVSGNMLRGSKGLTCKPENAEVLKPEWILYKNKSGLMLPNRTSSSHEYFGGYSDHLPVFVRFSNLR